MSKIGVGLIIFFSSIAGFGGGWIYDLTLGKDKAAEEAATAETTATAVKEQTLEECLTEVWGADKHAAVAANPNLATTDDNLVSLKCYK